MKIEVLDLGLNNIKSVVAVFLEQLLISDNLSVICNSSESANPDLLVLPGLGSFGAAMEEIRNRRFDELILSSTKRKVRLVGICLGMQLIGNNSEESPGVVGLGLIEGSSKKLVRQDKERIPNIGWAATNPSVKNSFSSLSGDRDFYFVHSYTFEPIDPENILCTTRYGETQFVSGVISEEVIGFQFHPEKSARAGAELISDVISWGKYEI